MKERTTPSPYRSIRTGPGPNDFRLELRPGVPRLAAVPTTDATMTRKTRDIISTKVLMDGTPLVEVETSKVVYAVGPITVSEDPPPGPVDLGAVHTGEDAARERDAQALQLQGMNKAAADMWNRDGERNRPTGDTARQRSPGASAVEEINRRNTDFWAAQGGNGPKSAA